MRKSAAVVVLLFCISLAGSCKPKGTAREFWTLVLKPCVESDLVGSKELYFGPSNAIGPGSIWRRDDNGGGYGLRFRPSDVGGNGWLQPGHEINCAGNASKAVDISPSLVFAVAGQPVSADIDSDFKDTVSVKGSARSARRDTVVEGVYQGWVIGGGVAPAVKSDYELGSRLFMWEAVFVKGFSAHIEFSSDKSVAFKAKYEGQIAGLKAASVGVGFKGHWTTDRTLDITAPDDDAGFYISGGLKPFNAQGFAAGVNSAPALTDLTNAFAKLDLANPGGS